MRRHLVLLVVLVLLLSVVVAAPAGAKKDPGLKERPFRATTEVVGEPVPSTSCPEGYEGEDSVSTGTGTHLGRFELFETFCSIVNEFPILEFEVDGLIVAANGDELRFTTFGTFDLVLFELVSTTGWVFDGGTGRFESATGSALETLIRDDEENLIGVEAVGTIAYDASDRSKK